jgi:hypothetical protein
MLAICLRLSSESLLLPPIAGFLALDAAAVGAFTTAGGALAGNGHVAVVANDGAIGQVGPEVSHSICHVEGARCTGLENWLGATLGEPA